MISSYLLLSLGATCWYINLKVLEQYFTIERVLDSKLQLQEIALLATSPIAVLLINYEPLYALLVLIYIAFCKNTLIQLANLTLRAIRMPVHFVDVLFSDFLTSYGKVFSDLMPILYLKPWVNR
eukprot:NODE_739_length_4684_cov_0.601091.p4 type:complete len:124 gc:universal NODE_739_length_4684_cov_0.601091:1290-919(-)